MGKPVVVSGQPVASPYEHDNTFENEVYGGQQQQQTAHHTGGGGGEKQVINVIFYRFVIM